MYIVDDNQWILLPSPGLFKTEIRPSALCAFSDCFFLPVLSEECRGQHDNCTVLLLLHGSPNESTVTFLLIGQTVLVYGVQSNHLQNVIRVTSADLWCGCVCWLITDKACTLLSGYSNPSSRLPSDSSMLQIWHQTFWKLLILFLCFTSLKSPLSLFSHFGSHYYSLKGFTLREVAAN